MNKLVVFDLDGTLCYTIEDIAISVNYALETNGYSVLSQEKIMSLVGNSVAYMIRNAMPQDETPEAIQKVFDTYTAHYAVHLCDHVRLYPKAKEALFKLKDMGFVLACVSNKPNTPCNDMIKKLFPEGLFSFVLGQMPSLVRKPDAQPLNFVFDYLDGDKNSSYYVGDSEVDVLFAHNAGIPCISCAWGYRSEDELKKAGAQKIIHSFEELPLILK